MSDIDQVYDQLERATGKLHKAWKVINLMLTEIQEMEQHDYDLARAYEEREMPDSRLKHDSRSQALVEVIGRFKELLEAHNV